jgi:Uma2 family endonuclease
VELIEGEILEMSPEGPAHAAMVEAVAEELRAAFGAGFLVRVGHPVVLDPDSEPEPGLLVVPGRPRDYYRAHPTAALLLVEVSHSSLPFDRTRKARLYARQWVPEYWTMDLAHEHLEAHRDPRQGLFTSVQVLGRQDRVSPLALPDVGLPVTSLLP